MVNCCACALSSLNREDTDKCTLTITTNLTIKTTFCYLVNFRNLRNLVHLFIESKYNHTYAFTGYIDTVYFY